MTNAVLMPAQIVARLASGAVVQNATITVYATAADGSDAGVADIFEDYTLTDSIGGPPTPKSNPFTIGPSDEGVIRFSVAGGFYNISVTDDDTTTTRRWELFPVGESQGRDSNYMEGFAGPNNVLLLNGLVRYEVTVSDEFPTAPNTSNFEYRERWVTDRNGDQTIELPTGIGTGQSLEVLSRNPSGTTTITAASGASILGGDVVLSDGDSVILYPLGGDVFRADVQSRSGGGGGLPDAPSDGSLYARKDGAWVSFVPGMEQTEIITAHTVVDADLGGNVVRKVNLASAGGITVNSGLTGSEPVTFIQTGPGQLTFVAGAGVTIHSPDGRLKSRARYSWVTLTPDSDAADTYYLTGDMTA